MGGYNPPTPWPQGSSGDEAPDGIKYFRTGVIPQGSAWRWDFTSKYTGMHKQPNNAFWNNDFIGDPSLTAAKDEWICIEFMVKMNTPGKSDGEQAFWINGQQHYMQDQLVSYLKEGSPHGRWIHDHFRPDPEGEPFEGFTWRTVPALNINYVWLSLYISGKPEGTDSELIFSNIVAATKYIGPIFSSQDQIKGKPVSKRKAVSLAFAHPAVQTRLKKLPPLSVLAEFDEEYRLWTVWFMLRQKKVFQVTVTEFGKVTDIREPEDIPSKETPKDPQPPAPVKEAPERKPAEDVEIF